MNDRKIEQDEEDKEKLFHLIDDGATEQVQQMDTMAMDLNYFMIVEQLAYLDECITPLIFCASVGRTEIAKILLRNQYIDIDMETPENGQTPLIAACMGHNYEMVKLLLDSGAQVNKPNALHQTPLVASIFRLLEEYYSFQVKRICLKIMELLVKRGADINWIVDKQKGYSMLHLLCSSKIKMSKEEKQINYDVIKFIIDSGADVSMRATDGKRAEDLALGHCSNTAILDLIIKKKEEMVKKNKKIGHLRKHSDSLLRTYFKQSNDYMSPRALNDVTNMKHCRTKSSALQPGFDTEFLSPRALKKKII